MAELDVDAILDAQSSADEEDGERDEEDEVAGGDDADLDRRLESILHGAEDDIEAETPPPSLQIKLHELHPWSSSGGPSSSSSSSPSSSSSSSSSSSHISYQIPRKDGLALEDFSSSNVVTTKGTKPSNAERSISTAPARINDNRDGDASVLYRRNAEDSETRTFMHSSRENVSFDSEISVNQTSTEINNIAASPFRRVPKKTSVFKEESRVESLEREKKRTFDSSVQLEKDLTIDLASEGGQGIDLDLYAKSIPKSPSLDSSHQVARASEDSSLQFEDGKTSASIHTECSSAVANIVSEESIHEISVSDSEDDVSFMGSQSNIDVSSSHMNFVSADDGLSSSDTDSIQEEVLSLLSENAMASQSSGTSSKNVLQPQEIPYEKPNPTITSQATAAKIIASDQNRSSLVMAEEAEKRASFSALHMEEGGSAHPMRLEGIQNALPTVGYLHIDSIDSVSQIFSSSTIFRDYGTAQALAAHGNNLAIGFSKGSVFLLPIRTTASKLSEPILLSSADKSYSSVTSLGFNMQGDLLLVGHANGFLALWEISVKGGSSKPVNVEHNAAIMHTAFLCTRYQRAISADCKGLVLLHTISWSTFGRFSVTKTQCLVDGHNTGMVLCLSPLSVDGSFDNPGNSNMPQASTTVNASTVLTSMVGGMVRGVVSGKSPDVVKKSVHEGGAGDEAGNIVVFVTHQSILVVRLPPFLEKCAMLPRPDGVRDSGIPYISWRRVESVSLRNSTVVNTNRGSQDSGEIKDTDEEAENDDHPLLVLAWDKKVFVLKLLKGALKILATWDLDSVACGVSWLDEQLIGVLTLKGQMCLFTREGNQVEQVNIESNEMKTTALSYHAHILNTFGNPEKTYHSSIAVQAGTMYLLGPLQVWRARLLPWQERIKSLQNAGDWMGAFHVGMEVFDGKALALMGLPRKIDLLQKAAVPVLLDLLSAYVDEAFAYLSLAFGSGTESSSEVAKAKEQYTRVGGVAIEFCVHIHQTDVLFNRIFNNFCNAGQRGTFLELLEPYILKDMLGTLAPEVMQALVEYYREKGWVQRVERCVLHMNIASLDFNQIVKLCRENELYSALIYLFNKGLDDFKSPLEELLIVAQDDSKPNARSLGYKMLVYLKYSFLGLAFPPGHGDGTISASRLPQLRSELLLCLLDDKIASRNVLQKSSGVDFIIHPRLSYLLSFDLKATLEVLQYAFPEDGPLGICEEHPVKSSEVGFLAEDNILDGLKLLQKLIDALIDILERIHLHGTNLNKHNTDVDAWHSYMSNVDAGIIMEFIGQYVASSYAKIPRLVLSRILDYLCSDDKKARKSEGARRKENLLVKLLQGVPDSEWDATHILELTLRAHFWQASACLLAKKGDYVAALDSYMKDREKPENAFQYILDTLSVGKGLPEDILMEFRKSTLARLPQLLQLSSEATLVIMLKHFSKEHTQIISDLKPYPPLLFQYLKQIMNARSGFKPSKPTGVPSVKQSNTNFHLLDNSNSGGLVIEDLSDLVKNAGLEFSNETEEQYVELLCKFEPDSVLTFLKSFEDYRLEHCLKLCQEHGITDAAAYLFERVGDVGSALSLALSSVDLHIHEMDLSVARLFVQNMNVHSVDTEQIEQCLTIPEVAVTYSIMKDAIELCQRNTWRMYPGESEALWFRLLDRFILPLQKLHTGRRELRRKRAKQNDVMGVKVRESSDDSSYKWKVVMIGRRAVDLMQRLLVYLIGEIVNGMMGYIPLSVIMDKLLSENGKHEFGDFKGTILQMLGLYGYEQTILFTAKHVVDDDMFRNISTYKRNATRGYAPNSSTCCVCKGQLDESDSARYMRSKSKNEKDSIRSSRSPISANGLKSVLIFLCGHAAHSGCIFPEIGLVKLRWDAHAAGCPVCPPQMTSSILTSRSRTRADSRYDLYTESAEGIRVQPISVDIARLQDSC